MSTSYEGFTATENVEKAAKFRKIAGKRLNVAVQTMRKLENCANARTYYYTEDQRLKIIAELEKGLERVRNAFDAQGDDHGFIEL